MRTEHAQAIASIALTLHIWAIVVVNLTPTPRDDAMLRRAYRILEALAGIFTPLAKR